MCVREIKTILATQLPNSNTYCFSAQAFSSNSRSVLDSMEWSINRRFSVVWVRDSFFLDNDSVSPSFSFSESKIFSRSPAKIWKINSILGVSFFKSPILIKCKFKCLVHWGYLNEIIIFKYINNNMGHVIACTYHICWNVKIHLISPPQMAQGLLDLYKELSGIIIFTSAGFKCHQILYVHKSIF